MSDQNDHSWRAAWVRGGRIQDVAWIGPDVLGWCSNFHIVFFDLIDKRVRLPIFPKHVVEAGACSLSGHYSRQVFAYAEKSNKARIMVHLYPSMEKVCECVNGTSNVYLATAFGRDFLFSVDSHPDFKLTIWSWRTGQKFYSLHTKIHDTGNFGQCLRVNYIDPIFIAQLGNKSRKLNSWEITPCGKTMMLSKFDINLPNAEFVQDFSWCPDKSNLMAIVDFDGHIYLSNAKGEEIRRIVDLVKCNDCLSKEPALIAWYQGGLILRTTFCQIQLYIEKKYTWEKVTHVKHSDYPILLAVHPFKPDRLFYVGKNGYLVQINNMLVNEEPKLEIKYINRGIYKFIGFIHPWDSYIVTIDDTMLISTIDAYTGYEIINFKLKVQGQVLCMSLHYDYPLTVLSTDIGEITFISFLHYYKPKILGTFRMDEEPLDLLKFSSLGRYLVAGEKNTGACFIFNISYTNSISVLTSLLIPIKIVDVLLMEYQNALKLYVLEGTVSKIQVGCKLLIYELKGHEFNRTPYVIILQNFYESLHYSSSEQFTVIGTPYLSKHIRFFKFYDWKDLALVNAIPNGHSLRRARIFINHHWLISYSIDGCIIVRNIGQLNIKKHFIACHQRNGGVSKATINSKGDLIVGLDLNGSLVALRNFEAAEYLSQNEKFWNFGRRINVQNDKTVVSEYVKTIDEKLLEFLSQKVQLFEQARELTWNQWSDILKFENEKKDSVHEKKKLIEQFTNLKQKIIQMLNNNEKNAEVERLPVAAFDLDITCREKKIKSAKDNRGDVKTELEMNCLEMDRVSDFIKIKFWDEQVILSTSVFGIYDDLEITNYPTSNQQFILKDWFKYAHFSHEVIADLFGHDSIRLWEVYRNPLELEREFNKQIRVKNEDEYEDDENNNDYDIKSIEKDEIDIEELRNRSLLEGLTTDQFIEPITTFYSQFKIYSLLQIVNDKFKGMEDCRYLRKHFNKKFDEIYNIKEREMISVYERIDRIHHINSELKIMFNEEVEKIFPYPQWRLKEQPQRIVEVTDEELISKAYISPSQQKLLDIKAAELERIRQLQLADDFREKAVDRMMDGVLEVKWEDLIKKDPIKPDCLLQNKNPDVYTDDDINSIEKYEEAWTKLNEDRQNYQRKLNIDYEKTDAMLKEGIDKFNERLEEFLLFKLKLESAIQRLSLRYLMHFDKHVRRAEDLFEDNNIKLRIKSVQHHTLVINDHIKQINNAEKNLLNKLETSHTKDKAMEKKLRSDFPSLGKSTFAALFSQYRRRPRIVLRTKLPGDFLDLGEAVVSLKKPIYLTMESFEFLKQLEALDIMPANLPPAINDKIWKNLVALRRLKINSEMKIRALSIHVDDVSRGIERYQQKIEDCAKQIESMKLRQKHGRSRRLEEDLDVDVQLVLKKWQVDLPVVNGVVFEDTAKAVMVPRFDLENVNKAILKAGTEKLTAMVSNIQFRRSIIAKEWEHELMKTRLQHVNAYLYFTETSNTSREIRLYLERINKGLPEDKTSYNLEKKFETERQVLERVLSKWNSKLTYIENEVMRLQNKNENLDKQIAKMNITRCDMKLSEDTQTGKRLKQFQERVVKLVAKRTTIIMKLLSNYEDLNEICKERKQLGCLVGKTIPPCVVDTVKEYE